jgi:hypothetical protein
MRALNFQPKLLVAMPVLMAVIAALGFLSPYVTGTG